MPPVTQALTRTAPIKREAALLAACLVFGFLALPVAIYAVGTAIFGEFPGGGLSGFVSVIYTELRGLDIAVWFLVFSPYLVIQLLRGTIRLFRYARSH